MQFRESNLETILLVNGPTDFDGVLTDDTERRHRPVVELRLGAGARPAAGESRRGHRRGAGHAPPRAEQAAGVLAGSRNWCRSRWPSARRLGLSDDWLKKLESREPEPAPGVVHRAPGRRLGGRGSPASRATSCWPSTTRWSPNSARSSWPWPTSRRCKSPSGAMAKRRSCRWPPPRSAVSISIAS